MTSTQPQTIPGFSIADPKPVRGSDGASRMGRFYKWNVLHDGAPLGLYFVADRHEDGELHRISLRTSKQILPHYKALGVGKEWLDIDYVDGGLGWEWASEALHNRMMPQGRNTEEPLLALLARRFQSMLGSMLKTDGVPMMEGWSAPMVSAVLIEKGWPVCSVSAEAWSEAYQDWKAYVDFRAQTPQAITIEEGSRGERWSTGPDDQKRRTFTFERIAHPESGNLIQSTVFPEILLNACGIKPQEQIGTTPNERKSVRP